MCFGYTHIGSSMLLQKIRHNFFIRFLICALFLLIIWKPFSLLYLHTITFFSNVFFQVIEHSVNLFLEGEVIKMQYPAIGSTPLRFSMSDPDQIFMNIIVFAALVISSYRVPVTKRIKYSAFSLIILFFIHMSVIYMYTITTIWDYVASQPDSLRPFLSDQVGQYFSDSMTETYRYVIFNWNSWGWDVIPLLLWTPVGIMQFSYLLPVKGNPLRSA